MAVASLSERQSTARIGAGAAFVILAAAAAIFGALAILSSLRSAIPPFVRWTDDLAPGIRVVMFVLVAALGFVYFRWLCLAMIRSEVDVSTASTGATVLTILTTAQALLFFFPSILPLETIFWSLLVTSGFLAALSLFAFVLGRILGWAWTVAGLVLVVVVTIIVWALL